MLELLKTLLSGVLFGAFFTALWFIVSGLCIHLLFDQLGLWDKIKWTITWKKDEKYLTKVDPIYKLTESTWSYSMYVEKWELGYTTKESVQFWLVLIPYPIRVEFYQYVKVGAFLACEKENVVEFSKKYTLEEFYDEKERERDLEIVEKNHRLDTIEQLNRVFNENYE